MFSTDFIFRQQENLVDNQKSQAGYRPLRNKILLFKYGNFETGPQNNLIFGQSQSKLLSRGLFCGHEAKIQVMDYLLSPRDQTNKQNLR